jgi:hypothetical protein
MLALLAPALALVTVKDSLSSPTYCALCHAQPYYTSWAQGPDDLAHKHAQLGISCQTCHGRDLGTAVDELVTHITGNYTVPLWERTLPMDTCFQCHDSYEAVVPLTDPARTGAERNPHAGHWGTLECAICHNMHRTSVDYCGGCHNPVTTAPAWETPATPPVPGVTPPAP